MALITGGNSGIGLGMADALAASGAGVCIWGRNEERNRAAEQQLAAHGGKVLALQCDVADEDAVERSFAATLEHFGQVVGCFANAGVGGGGGPFVGMTTGSWRRVLGINLDGAFLTFRAAARRMVERGEGGSLVATASVAAIDGAPRSEHHAASKGGLLAMMRALVVEPARHQITANSIVAGWIETPMTEGPLGDERFVDAVMRRAPFRRRGEPSDVGGIAVYLMSDASRYHTGEHFVIDGRYTKF